MSARWCARDSRTPLARRAGASHAPAGRHPRAHPGDARAHAKGRPRAAASSLGAAARTPGTVGAPQSDAARTRHARTRSRTFEHAGSRAPPRVRQGLPACRGELAGGRPSTRSGPLEHRCLPPGGSASREGEGEAERKHRRLQDLAAGSLAQTLARDGKGRRRGIRYCSDKLRQDAFGFL
jgi:hypothetical protein